VNIVKNSVSVMDSFALGASFICLVHCLALPIVIAALPALAAVIELPASFHLWMLAFAAPASLTAVAQGWRHHRRAMPAVLAVVGLLLLAGGLTQVPDSAAEIALSVGGGLVLAAGHVRNWQLRFPDGHHGPARAAPATRQ
jgi:hypothetical protein